MTDSRGHPQYLVVSINSEAIDSQSVSALGCCKGKDYIQSAIDSMWGVELEDHSLFDGGASCSPSCTPALMNADTHVFFFETLHAIQKPDVGMTTCQCMQLVAVEKSGSCPGGPIVITAPPALPADRRAWWGRFVAGVI